MTRFDANSTVLGAKPGSVPAILVGLLLLAAVCTAAFSSGTANAQLTTEWRTTLGGNSDEFAHALALTTDGGYVIAGETRSFGSGERDGWMVKLDAVGNQVWARRLGGQHDDVFYDIQATSDGGFILAGETHSLRGSSPAQSDFWLVKTNSKGQVEWQRNFGNWEMPDQLTTVPTSDVAYSVLQTRSGGFILAGNSNGTSGNAVWVIRTGPNGKVLWSRNPGVASGAVAYDVAQSPDGGFAIAGSASSGSKGSEGLLIKIDAEGNTEWTNSFGGQFNEEARSLVLTGDGGYVLAGFTWSSGSGQSDYWLLKADSNGRRFWERTFGGLARDSAHSLIQTSDGGFAIAGWSESFSSGERFWIIKTSSSGNLQWSRAYTETPSLLTPATDSPPAGARAIRQTEDLGFVVAGWSGSIEGTRDILVIKTGPVEEWPVLQQGPVITLENTSKVAIDSVSMTFRSTETGEIVGPLRFWYNGRIVGRDNPLPPSETACSQPYSGLEPEAQLIFDQIGSFNSIFLSSLFSGDEEIVLATDRDPSSFALELGEQTVSGNIAMVTESPCELGNRHLPEGPSGPVGLSASSSETHRGAIQLDWEDIRGSGVSGYAVYFGATASGPFQQLAWMVPESNYSDIRAGDGSKFYYAVTAIDLWGIESPVSYVGEFDSFDITPPRPPTGLRVLSVDRALGRATLEWNIATGDSIRGYRLYRQDDDGPRTPITALLFGTRFEDWTFPTEGTSTYTITSVDLAGNESPPSSIAPLPLDFFGSVLEVTPSFAGGGRLSVNTSRGIVEFNVASTTDISIPNRENPGLDDLDLGDTVAVALSQNGSIARQVHLVPSSTRSQHITGLVTELSDNEVVIQPAVEDIGQLRIPLFESVKITPHRGAAGLSEGAFVIISYIAASGESLIGASEINIVPTPGAEESGEDSEIGDASLNVAVLRGVFEGINRQNANIFLSSIELSLGVHTVMESGLSVGEPAFAEAKLLPDGSLLAQKVGRDNQVSDFAARTILRGVFQGRTLGSGGWLVSGTQLLVDRLTNAELLPDLGQEVRISAILRDDGSLYARDIHNLSTSSDAAGEHIVHIEGIFRRITPSGEWDVGGIGVNVSSRTELLGRPSLDGRVSVVAVYKGGLLEAQRVSSASAQSGRPVRTATIRGVIGSYEEDLAVVVDGVRVALSSITKTLGNIEVGSTAIVKAEIDAKGNLTAREVSEVRPDGQTKETRASPVDIEGRIERVLPDGGLLVNGIPIQVSSLTEIEAGLQVGAPVQVRGLLQRDGSVLAREVLGYGPAITGGTEARIEGVVSRVSADASGQISSFIVEGITVIVDRLSRLEVEPTNGVAVLVQAIVVDGKILAISVESQPIGNVGVLPTVHMQGVVNDMPTGPVPLPLDITINGVTVRISDDTRIAGSIRGGAVAKVAGRISDGIFLAQEIERVTVFEYAEEMAPIPFRIRGILMDASLDSDGRPDRLLVSGERIIVETLSEFRDEVFVGDSIVVEGMIRDGILVATVISLNRSAGENAPSNLEPNL